MPRPSWSGQVQISLVSFEVEIYPAAEAASEVSFHEIDRKTGERIRHQTVSERGPVDRADIVKGYEYRKGEYITIEPKEIEDLRLKSKHTFEIVSFVEATHLDPRFFERPYFVLPKNQAQSSTFAVIRKALEETGTAGLGEITFGGREHLVALMPPPVRALRGLMAYTLRYATELRTPAEYFSKIKHVAVDAEQLSLAKDLIKRKRADFEPSKFVDDYEVALKELVDAKLKHKRPLPAEPAPKRGVINLMDALRRSLEGGAIEKDDRKRERPPLRAKRKRKGPILVKSSRRKTA